MTERNEEMPETDTHTLLVVQEDSNDDNPQPYQIAALEHPPDAIQTSATEDAMSKVTTEAEKSTGTSHELVKITGNPEKIERKAEKYKKEIHQNPNETK